jgi:hypothetical protein
MIPEFREAYNRNFSVEKYKAFLADLDRSYGLRLTFRVAESPVFIPRAFGKKLFRASDEIIDFLCRPDFRKLTQRAIPEKLKVPGETDHTLFLALDYAIVRGADGELTPQLIELQGFPSLFGFQHFVAGKFREHFGLPPGLSPYFGLSEEDYVSYLRRVLLGNHSAENVILLEIDPLTQNTAIDFIITEKLTGIKPVHIGDVNREGRRLYYLKEGKRTPIYRIYNRVIFDELVKRTDLTLSFNLTEDVDVEWAGHPNWFFRISKFTMPLMRSAFIPECRLLSDFERYPTDLENYVLKPLFSFSGSGVVFHVTAGDLDAVPSGSRSDYMLQRKVQYEPVVRAPDGMVKAELRLLFIWEEGQPRPRPVTNLVRLSRGEMIGVKYNKDKTWVGGSVGFYEPLT